MDIVRMHYIVQSNMNTDQSQTLSQIIEKITGDRIHEKKGGKFFFYFHLSSKMNETPIEALELGVREYNSLKKMIVCKILCEGVFL